MFNPDKFYNFISSFFGFLDDPSRDTVENWWEGLDIVGNEMSNRSGDFLAATAPEQSNVETQEKYYEVIVSPLTSLPLVLDPTDPSGNYLITPKSIIINEPIYE